MSEGSRGHWAAGRAFRQVAGRFRDGCDRLPRAAWRRWLRIVVTGYATLILLTVGLVRLAAAFDSNGSLAWEDGFLRRLETELPLSFSSAIWVQTLGTDLTLIFVALFVAGTFAWAGRSLWALSVVAAYLLLDLVVRMAWLLWDRARPDLILDGAAAPGFASFPSGHTAKSVAVYGFLAFFWAHSSSRPAERIFAGLVALSLVSLVMLGRLRMGVHWPTDVLAGALIGGVWAVVLATALRVADAGVDRDDG